MSERTILRIAWGLFALGLLLFAITSYLERLAGHAEGQDILTVAVFLPVYASFVGIGAIIVSRQPRNPVGWAMVAFFFMAPGLLVGGFAEWAATQAVVPAAAPWSAWLFGISIGVTVVPFAVVLLYFPDGRLLSRRWRAVVWLAVFSSVLAMGGEALGRTQQFEQNFPGMAHPLHAVSTSVATTVSETGQLFTLLAFLLSAAAPFVRFHGSTGDERLQLKWVAFAATMFAVGITVIALASPFGLQPVVAFILFVPLIPIAIGIGILKYHLYDIDVVINRTVVYATLAATITIIYVAIVVGVGTLAGSRGSPFLSAIAAALVALAFGPARRWAQRLANRLVYGKRATPYEVLSGFSERLGEAYSIDDVLPRMAKIVADGTGATRVSVWVRVGDELRAAASWPNARTAGHMRTLEDLPDRAFEVRHQTELLGAITVAMPPSEPMTPAQEKLIADVAAQAGLVIRNVALLEDLRESRRRIVAAQDDRARALERNIHDGAQQQLVALAVKAKLAQAFVERDPSKVTSALEDLQRGLQDALEDLRDLARGIYPPLLADQGLVAALEGQARKAAIAVTVEPDGVGRYPQDIEAAVYFCALEALNNVAKYAQASSARVRLSASKGLLAFEVTDDGVGFDPAETGHGTGLQGMADRLAAIGGEVEIRSAPGAGTTVAGRIPAGEAL